MLNEYDSNKNIFTEQISSEVSVLFNDVTEEFSQISSILDRFEEWRKNDFTSYKETYFSLCLPKVCPYDF